MAGTGVTPPRCASYRAAAALLPPPDLDEPVDGRARLRTVDAGPAGGAALCRRFPAGAQPCQSRGARCAVAGDGEPAPGPAADAGGRNGLRTADYTLRRA